MTVAERIKIARKKAGMTQEELGRKLGVSGSMIAQYETGKRNPKYETLLKIASVLDVPITTLSNYVEAVNFPGFFVDPSQYIPAVRPYVAYFEPLTSEEEALRILLRNIGYNVLKAKGKYFFVVGEINEDGFEISGDDVKELLHCAENGLKVAAKTLELKRLQRNLSTESLAQQPSQAPTPPDSETTPEDK